MFHHSGVLVPTQEGYDPDKATPGVYNAFYFNSLPFADDLVRVTTKRKHSVLVTEDQMKVMEKLVNELSEDVVR